MLLSSFDGMAGTAQPSDERGHTAGALPAPDHALRPHLHGWQETRGELLCKLHLTLSKTRQTADAYCIWRMPFVLTCMVEAKA